MKQHLVKIESIRHITPDVLQIVTEKPPKYTFTSGQATEVAINKTGWKDKKRPFTVTCLPDNAPEAYKHFDARDKGWTKVILKPER